MILNDYTRYMLLTQTGGGSKQGLQLCTFQFLKTNGVGREVKWHFSAAKLFLTHISNAPSCILNWPVNFLIRTQKLDRACFWLSRMRWVLEEYWIYWHPYSTEIHWCCKSKLNKFFEKILAFHLWDECLVSVHIPTKCEIYCIIPLPGSSE